MQSNLYDAAMTMRNDAVRKVLIYRLGSLGDMLIALPALRLVERAFPNAHRRMLTNFPVNSKAPSAEAILGESGLVRDYQSYPVGVRNWKTLMDLRAQIRAWVPDVLVYLTIGRGRGVAWRDAAFFRMCGIRRMIGVPYSKRLQQNLWLEDCGVLEPEAGRLARCVAELGDARLDDPQSWDLGLTGEEQQAAEAILGAAKGRPIIAASVGTKVQAKDWGAANWKELMGRMGALYPGHALMLIGAVEERTLSEEVGRRWTEGSTLAGPVVNLCGELTPRQSAAAMAHARIFVGHDSGPMHLAASVQTPCVAIFAARNKPAVWFPYGRQHQVVYHRTDCWGCDLETCIEQRKKCLTSVSVEEVLERVTKVFPPPLAILADGGSVESAGAVLREDS